MDSRLALTEAESKAYTKFWGMAPVKDGLLTASVVSKLLGKSGLPVVSLPSLNLNLLKCSKYYNVFLMMFFFLHLNCKGLS